MQEVHILKSVTLIDSPGVVASPSNAPASLALRSLQVEQGQETVLEAVRTLLKQCDHSQVTGVPIAPEDCEVWIVLFFPCKFEVIF